jgi:hypothetical protein
MKLIKRPSPVWLEIISDLLINLSAGLFILLFIEPLVMPFKTLEDFILLTYKLLLGILFLILAKKLKEDSRK